MADPAAEECWLDDAVGACQIGADQGEADALAYGAVCDCASVEYTFSVDRDPQAWVGICGITTKSVIYHRSCTDVVVDAATDCYAAVIESACAAVSEAVGCPPPT